MTGESDQIRGQYVRVEDYLVNDPAGVEKDKDMNFLQKMRAR